MIDHDRHIVHHPEPPCPCIACARATAKADQRRAELDAILRRLDDAERLSRESE